MSQQISYIPKCKTVHYACNKGERVLLSLQVSMQPMSSGPDPCKSGTIQFLSIAECVDLYFVKILLKLLLSLGF